MAVVATWTGREVRALRQALRMTIRGFAERYYVGSRTISFWEGRGAGAALSAGYSEVMDRIFAEAGEDAQERFRLLVPSADRRAAEPKRQRIGNPDNGLLAELIANPSRIDEAAAEHIQNKITDCKHDDGRTGASRTLPALLSVLKVLDICARRAPEPLRLKLLEIASDGAEFAGWLHRDLLDLPEAGYWYDRAMQYAQEARSPGLQGWVLLRKSQLAFDVRDPAAVGSLADAARYGPWKPAPHVLAEIVHQQALAVGMLGGTRVQIERHLEEADSFLQHSDESAVASGTCPPEMVLQLRRAACWIEAGEPQNAAELLVDVLNSEMLSRRDSAYYQARLSQALALSGAVDEAARIAQESFRVAQETTSDRTVRVLRVVASHLAPWGSRPGPERLRHALAVQSRS
jgi:hypothetical protein